jgi:hypothetical protein
LDVRAVGHDKNRELGRTPDSLEWITVHMSKWYLGLMRGFVARDHQPRDLGDDALHILSVVRAWVTNFWTIIRDIWPHNRYTSSPAAYLCVVEPAVNFEILHIGTLVHVGFNLGSFSPTAGPLIGFRFLGRYFTWSVCCIVQKCSSYHEIAGWAAAPSVAIAVQAYSGLDT